MDSVFYSTGRRKESTARVFLSKGTGKNIVNSNPIEKYFGRKTNIMVVKQALNLFDTIILAPLLMASFMKLFPLNLLPCIAKKI